MIHTSPQNPNESAGVRACLATGMAKHPDCGGQWNTFRGVVVVGFAQHATICDNHLRQLAETRGFKTPKVTERKPKPKARTPEPVPAL